MFFASDFKLFANVDLNRNSYWVARNTSMCVAKEHRDLVESEVRVGKKEILWFEIAFNLQEAGYTIAEWYCRKFPAILTSHG